MVHRFAAQVGDRTAEVTVELLEDGAWRVSVDGRARIVEARRVESGAWSLLPRGGGRARLVDVDRPASANAGAGDLLVTAGGELLGVKLVEGRAAIARVATARAASGPQPLRAPMPGKVVKVLLERGAPVKTGQGVLVIEAMKMENELRAPRDGSLVEIGVREGQAVEAGQVLATIG
jgi:biotin carboxyl carrier protein